MKGFLQLFESASDGEGLMRAFVSDPDTNILLVLADWYEERDDPFGPRLRAYASDPSARTFGPLVEVFDRDWLFSLDPYWAFIPDKGMFPDYYEHEVFIIAPQSHKLWSWMRFQWDKFWKSWDSRSYSRGAIPTVRSPRNATTRNATTREILEGNWEQLRESAVDYEHIKVPDPQVEGLEQRFVVCLVNLMRH